MLGREQPRIVWPHRATLKYGEVIGLLKPDSHCNINFSESRWVRCLVVAEIARS